MIATLRDGETSAPRPYSGASSPAGDTVLSTEDVSSRFSDLDLWPTHEIVRAMLEGQLAAAAAVQPHVEVIAKAAEDAAARLNDPTGRLMYVGAGTSGRIAAIGGVELGPTFARGRALWAQSL